MSISFEKTYRELSDSNKKLIMMRLKGKSYKDISEYAKTHDFSLSSREMRRVIDDAIHHDFTEYNEYKYAEIYRTMAWTADKFEKIFRLSRIVFLFLSYHIPECGNIPIPRYLLKSDTKSQFKISNLMFPSNVESFIFWTLLLNPSNKKRRGYSSQDLMKVADWQKLDIVYNELEASLQKMKNAIEVQTGEYLFFDSTKLSLNNKKFSRSVWRKKGIYSIEKIFEESQEFYKSIGIGSSLSLHDIVRKYKRIHDKADEMKILPYPNVVFGYRSKNEYFQALAKQSHNKTLDDVIENLHSENGLDRDYVRYGFRMTNKGKLGKGDVINITNIAFTDRQIELLAKKFTCDYYTLDEFHAIIQKVKKSVPRRIIETDELKRLGYRKEYNYCIRSSITDIRKHIEKKIMAEDFLLVKKDAIVDTIEMSIIESLVANFKLVRISDDEFITARKLRAIGINKKDILAFLQQVFMMIGKNQYFTISQLYESAACDLIENSSFDKRFFEELLSASMRFQKIRVGGDLLYHTSMNRVSQKDFIGWCFEGFDDSISIFDAVNWINCAFKISISLYTVKSLAEDNGFYYDESFEKIYKDKHIFLKEVFGNE